MREAFMGRRILITEDNPQNRLLVKDVLEFHGYEIMEAEDGQAGIEMAKKYKPDLILMDLQMPVMDGLTAGKIIRGDPDTKNIKMIAVTSFAMLGDKERVMEAGFDHYIAKPINTRELPDLVKRILGNEKVNR
jgi:CheY-like chemotaxis protein